MFTARKRLVLVAIGSFFVLTAALVFSTAGAAGSGAVSLPTIGTAGIATALPPIEPRGVKVERRAGLNSLTTGSLLNLIFTRGTLLGSSAPDPFFANLCTSGGGLTAGDPNWARPSIVSRGTGFGACTPQATSDFNYDAYDFSVNGCAVFPSKVDITLCGPAGCAPVTGAGALADSTLWVYRTGGSLTAGTGSTGSFVAGSPCTNIVAGNGNLNGTQIDPFDFMGQGAGNACDANVPGFPGTQADCPAQCVANTSLSGVRRKLGPGVFTVVVSSNGSNETGTYSLYVDAPGAGCTVVQGAGCPTITVTPATVPSVPVNTAFPPTVFSAAGGTGPYTFSMTGTLPTGMTFTAATGTLSGTPTQQGNFPITINVTDANGCGGSRQLSVVVTNSALACITDVVNPGGPTFLRPDTQAALPGHTGTTTPGNNVLYKAYEFNVAGCAAGTGTFTATLCGPAGCPPALGTGALADPRLYIYRTGGSLTAGTGSPGAFVAGTSLNNLLGANDNQGQASSNGLAACPTNSLLPGFIRTVGLGRFQVVVAAISPDQSTADGFGAYTMNATMTGAGCTLTAVGACPTIDIGPTAVSQGQINVPYPTQTFTASGGAGPYTYAMTGTLPTGLNFNAGAGTITGTPTQSGGFTITITATDSSGCQGSKIYNVVITNPALACITDGLATGAPTFDRPSLQTAMPGFQLCPAASGITTRYKKYDFNLTGAGCTTGAVTVSLCSPSGCTPISGPGAIPDAALFLYRTNGLSGGAGNLGAFDPAASCTNLVAANGNQGQASSGGSLVACAANSGLPGLVRTLGNGYFSVVVAGNGATDEGAYSMNVTTSTAGCSITQFVPATINKAFSPTSVVSGQPSTVTLSLSSANIVNLTGVTVSDTLTNMSAVGGAVGGTCSGTTPNTLSAGDTALNFTGITVPPAGCTITFGVKSFSPGVRPNTTTGSTSVETGATIGTASNTAQLTVAQAATTAAILTDLPDPSFPNQNVVVTYSVSVTAPGTGTPTGNVTVTDGVNSCMGTVAAGQCTLALATSGPRTLTATYNGPDPAYSASPASPGVPHVVSTLTSAGVSVSGRVRTADGRAIRAARVTLTDTTGKAVTVTVGANGTFVFEDITPGQTYVLTVGQRRFTFEPRVIQIEDNVTDLDIIGQP